MAERWNRLTEGELTEKADTGLQGQGAIVEAMRRLRVSSNRIAASANRLALTILVCTLVLIALTVLQIVF